MVTDGDTFRPGQGVVIPTAVVEWRFTPSGGPGGQHANRSNTRAEARLDLTTAPGIPDDVRDRLIAKLGRTIDVTADETRSQHRNRQAALDRIDEQLRDALRRAKRRRPTRPSRRAEQRRLESKKQRSETKRMRGRVRRDE